MSDLRELKEKVDYLVEQEATRSDFPADHVFTVAEVTAMDSATYQRNEKRIRQQYREGKIKE